MSTTWKWVIGIGIGVIIIGGIIWWMKSNKKAQIKDAALKSGLSEKAATDISESTNPPQRARELGVSAPVADAIANGFSVSGVAVFTPTTSSNDYLKYTGTGTFYQCTEPAIRKDTGRVDENGNKLYDCYISVATV